MTLPRRLRTAYHTALLDPTHLLLTYYLLTYYLLTTYLLTNLQAKFGMAAGTAVTVGVAVVTVPPG